MKRYDKYVGVVSRQTGVFSSANDYEPETIKKIDHTKYKVLVKCRRCCCIHEVIVNCQGCDIETKTAP